METLSNSNNQSWLPWFLRGILFLSFLVLFSRLADLQVIKGAYYKNLAEGNRIRKVSLKAPRGNILARNGEILVGNLDIRNRVVFDPIEGYFITRDLEGASDEEIIIDPMRDYKLGSMSAHITGYLGEAGIDEVDKVRGECIEKGPVPIGIRLGRSGLEQYYDCLLRGTNGEELVEVDARGYKIRMLGVREPVAGTDLLTNIDYNLQEKISGLMVGLTGGIVVTDSEGRVLALYSSPSYDPNIFINSGKENVSEILDDKNMPLFNRVISGKYPPGSVFKPLIGLAALEESIIDSGFSYLDTGYIEIDEYRYRNWFHTQHGGTEGEIDLVRAMARSTDTFFYKLGEIMGIGLIEKWGGIFGLGDKTGIDLVGEVAGIMPGREWKLKNKNERWFLGNTYHLSIGQGDMSSTPMQIHKAILAIANDGRFCKPRVVGDPECEDLSFQQKNVDLIKKGMQETCTRGGTAFPFFDFPTDTGESVVACKTGTAETGVSYETHAWFVAFSPIVEPEIVVTVLVEKGGEGSYDAGPIAREIFDYWFEIEKADNTIEPLPELDNSSENE